jgi:hypothetical protein
MKRHIQNQLPADPFYSLVYSQNTFDFNYPGLSQWTHQIPNAPRACFVTLGPNLSYFASAKGHGSTWAGIPSDLSDKVQKAFDTPNCVSLGVNNAWFVMWPDGYYSWKFYGSYGGLDKTLRDAEPRTVDVSAIMPGRIYGERPPLLMDANERQYLAISPYNPEHYFVAFRDRTVKYNFAGAPEWIPQIEEVFREWQNEIAQSQYQQVSQPQWNSQTNGYLSPPTPAMYSPYNAMAASQPVITRSSSTDVSLY